MSAEPKGWHSRGYLPHLDDPDLVQSVTFRLGDSLPASLAQTPVADVARRRRIDQLLDGSYGDCCLRQDDCASVVENALLHLDGDRYRLLAWCIMPNHVHALIESDGRHSLPGIVHSWKSFTAKAINTILSRNGRLWAADYFDRYVRDEGHLATIIAYVENNPVKARLVERPQDWRWSSAPRRA